MNFSVGCSTVTVRPPRWILRSIATEAELKQTTLIAVSDQKCKEGLTEAVNPSLRYTTKSICVIQK
jgi:hypothetical protein